MYSKYLTIFFIIVLFLGIDAIQLTKRNKKRSKLHSTSTSKQCELATPSEGCVWLYSNYITKVEVCSNVPDLRAAEYNFDKATLSVLPGPNTIVTLWSDYNYAGESRVRSSNKTYQLLDFPCAVSSVQIAPANGYMIRGYIKNAQTNLVFDASALQDISIVFISSSGKNYSATIYTANSTYSVQLPVGTYVRQSSLTNYAISSSEVTIESASNETNSKNTVLLSAIFQGWRAILIWDAEKDKDLDSYTLLADKTKVYYRQRTSSDKTVVLDVDNRDGSGPETTSYGNFTDSSNATFKYYVNSYTKKVPIVESGAKVEVYHGDTQVGEFSVPTTGGQGYWWKVFELTINGADQTFVPVSEIKTSMS